MVFLHLEGGEISWGLRNFSDKFKGHVPTNFESPRSKSFIYKNLT